MLSPYRVLDLSDDRGQLCGQILGDLGADVVLVEPHQGSRLRHVGPYADGVVGHDRSLAFWAQNRNKRSMVADLDQDAGRQRVKKLASRADFLIESFRPGYMDEIGLGWKALSEANPGLIMVSISPFGQDGPKANWAASDLTVLASAGVLDITGDDDRPPVRVVVPQGFLHAAAEAAASALIALQARARDGLGQHIDVSAQTAAMMATQAMCLNHGYNEALIHRFGGGVKLGPLHLRFVQPAKDGYVSVTFLFGTAIGPFSIRLMEVMHERGFVDKETRDKDWIGYTGLLLSGAEPTSELMRVQECIGQFTAAHTKAELFELAMTRGLLIAPVSRTDDLVHSPQLESRNYWTYVRHPELDRPVLNPGPFAKFGAKPIKYRRRPPLLGEHDNEIDANWGPHPDSPSPAGASNGRALPLAGLKVLDFMWVFAGPAGSRSLADYGATQIKVESSLRVDTARTLQPFKDGIPGPERSGVFISVNAGKLGLTLNMAKPEGRDIALRLAKWADVVLESYSPKAMRTWGLDYSSLKELNPGLIMLSSCLNGQTGPHAGLAGFGTMGAQLAGFGELAGWPDRPPAGPFGAYTDYVAPKFTVAAVMAALDHRRRTGEGQYIDLSQAEASLHFLGPAFLDNTVNGHVWSRNGNVSEEFAPHGVYPSAEEDRWVAIVAETQEQWQSLCEASGNSAWATDARFLGLADRLANREALDTAVAAWTSTLPGADIEQRLQAAAVPCHRVVNSEDLFADPQVQHRKHFVTVEHGELGPVPVENARAIFSATPARVERAGPTFGQHNDYVLREILGLGDDEIIELVAAGALE
jgi:crotonobetainyl-CoA:carnitine CoA-transferase CaiB-like acyl-CoA transferase